MKGWGVVLAAALAALLGGSGGAFASTTIEYRATDLADLIASEDLWRYEYRVSGRSFLTDIGFDVYFPLASGYQSGDLGAAVPANADWDVLTLPPDPLLPADGAYDALALVDGASLAGFFSIDFIWRGAGKPGTQPFEIYDARSSLSIPVLESGVTIPLRDGGQVPVPGTLGLLVCGWVALASCRRAR